MANREKFTLEQRIEMVLLVSGFMLSAYSFDKVFTGFRKKFPGLKLPDKRTFTRTYYKFLKTGSVADCARTGRPRKSDGRIALVDEHFKNNRTDSLRKVTALLRIAKTSLHRILKSLCFHPYKLAVSQLLRVRDLRMRRSFCHYVKHCLSYDRDFLRRWVTTDEACFSTSGVINRQNCRVWSKEHPHVVLGSKNQSAPKVMVWAGICNQQIIGPFFFDENVSGKTYLHMLSRQMIPDMKKKLPEADFKRIIFQQDGAGPHFSLKVRRWLNRRFPGRWVGRHGKDDLVRCNWPSRSPDLAPCDWFLWGFIKSKIYDPSLPIMTSKDDLRRRILDAFKLVTPEMLDHVQCSWPSRLDACILAKGSHFESKLKQLKRVGKNN